MDESLRLRSFFCATGFSRHCFHPLSNGVRIAANELIHTSAMLSPKVFECSNASGARARERSLYPVSTLRDHLSCKAHGMGAPTRFDLRNCPTNHGLKANPVAGKN